MSTAPQGFATATPDFTGSIFTSQDLAEARSVFRLVFERHAVRAHHSPWTGSNSVVLIWSTAAAKGTQSRCSPTNTRGELVLTPLELIDRIAQTGISNCC